MLIESIGGFDGDSGGASGLVAYGASGQSAGDGGSVTATLQNATLNTNGVHSAGLIALSVGGGGGVAGPDDGVVALGATGGAGGAGGEVTVTLAKSSTITTQDFDSPGILALSVGGGGGKSTSPAGMVALGADGGTGGDGSDVTFDLQAGTLEIKTGGHKSHGILAASIGGGGGLGGSSFELGLGIAVPPQGSSGGVGGDGGDMTITSKGGGVDIETWGDITNGVIVQSVGGGGGTGGNSVTVGVGATFNPQTGATDSAVGGHGGSVKIGDQSTVGLTGSVTTHGDDLSSAILVQSVGGGGGSAGNSVEANAGIEFDHDMGTNCGSGGDGGAVTVNSKTDATTYGDHSDGILVQSVGGGGGQSSNVVDADGAVDLSTFAGNQGSQGGSGGSGGAVWVQSDGTVSTQGTDSLGVLAQSIGGGGGKGGSTIDAGITAGFGVTLGSAGGDGGDTSGTVDLTTAGSVKTQGDLSTGVLAQSVAGGGGVSGTTVNGNFGANLDYSHGGNGGAGGTASDVTLTNQASVTTAGSSATGVLAQSMGGGGGSGGVTASGSFGIVGDLNITHGGDAGDGGTAGKVTLTNTNTIDTSGDSSHGVFAQSLGGSGGTGGFLGTGSGAAGPISGSVNVSVGGDGGKGGQADSVNITNSGQITTSGYQSTGMTAQSIGGNGGDGGAVGAGAIDLSAEAGGSVTVSVGGDGGDASSAQAVTMTNNSGGDITTTGHLSYGIFAQSIGGNGGKGGGSYALTLSGSDGPTTDAIVTIGGSGGSGAVGNSVTVENDAMLKTSGGNAHGIYAQSVGGNGGVGGYGFFHMFDGPSSNFHVDANVSVGGSGGNGEHAGSVTVKNRADITTQTETSYGIYAQSVGGGGGDGGQAGSHAFGYTLPHYAAPEEEEEKSYSLNFTMGGDQGASGNGNDVSVTHSEGTISTAGNASYAIYAQSVGGGGGNSGNGSPGKGWVADIYNTYELLEELHETYEQVKGFPKNELSFEIDIGGKAGASGTGGAVTVTNSADLNTTGDNGTAIYAQSVGGGGGSGGDGSQGLLTSITVARSGSGGGNGGDVTVTNNGTIRTSGVGAKGIYAQSVGGGGGTAGDVEENIVTGIANFYETLGAQIFGSDNGGNGGNGGDVEITIGKNGSIHTTNENAHGIWAQSVGGGGGAAGSLGTSTDDVGIGSAGDGGNGGNLYLDVGGSIHVEGTGAHGIFAQSASGSDGYSGGVTVRVEGRVRAEGENARAILAQASEVGDNDPSGNQAGSDQCAKDQCRGAVHIYIEPNGHVETTSSKAHETIAILGGRSDFNQDGTISYSNMVVNQGRLESADPESVVIANDNQGALRIHNLSGGILSGSLQLDDANRVEFENEQGAYFHAGKTVYLGKKGFYTGDDGSTMSPYGQDVIGTSTVSFGGTYTEAGTLWIDLQQNSDGSLTNDQIVFDGLGEQGAKVSLTGNIQPAVVGSSTFSSGDKGQMRIASLQNSASLAAYSAKVVDTATVDYSLSTGSSDSDLYVNYAIDYSGGAAGADLEDNERSYANYLSSALAAIEADESSTAAAGEKRTRSATATLANAAPREATATAKAPADMDDTEDALSMLATSILNTRSTDELESIYDRQTPEESLIGASRAFSIAYRLNELMLRCPTSDAAAGAGVVRPSSCAWAQAIGSRLSQNETDESPEFSETSWGLALGAQHEMAPDTFLAVTGLFETLSIDGSNFSQDGERYSVGLAVKREIGRYTLSASLGAGMYSLDYDRDYRFADLWRQADSEIDGRFLGTELRASAVFLGEGGYYAKPSAALAYTRVWQDGFSESGSGPLNWQVDAVNDGWIALTPMLELGRAFATDDRVMRAFVRAGVTAVLNDPSVHGRSKLRDADIALGTLNNTMTVDRYRGDLAAGFQAQLRDNLSLSLLGQAALSQNSHDYGGSAQLEWRF
ncbi:MAG: autotransporter outer membrane beta-barrel domain-containing protein [Chromatiaceae bacterium]|nr:autotransporter outer membrane beta-barrel domain-containing protein [Chromatiaceae bacterium]